MAGHKSGVRLAERAATRCLIACFALSASLSCKAEIHSEAAAIDVRQETASGHFDYSYRSSFFDGLGGTVQRGARLRFRWRSQDAESPTRECLAENGKALVETLIRQDSSDETLRNPGSVRRLTEQARSRLLAVCACRGLEIDGVSLSVPQAN